MPEGCVAPSLIDCPQCREMAVCSTDTAQDEKPEYEWYVPDKKRGITKEERKKFDAHGIYLRKIKTV